MLPSLKNRLLGQLMLAVLLLITAQTFISVTVTNNNVSELVDKLTLQLSQGNQSVEQALDKSGLAIASAMEQLTVQSQDALSTTLNKQLKSAQLNIANKLNEQAINNAMATATLLASVSPPLSETRIFPN